MSLTPITVRKVFGAAIAGTAAQVMLVMPGHASLPYANARAPGTSTASSRRTAGSAAMQASASPDRAKAAAAATHTARRMAAMRVTSEVTVCNAGPASSGNAPVCIEACACSAGCTDCDCGVCNACDGNHFITTDSSGKCIPKQSVGSDCSANNMCTSNR
eukprot:gene10649-20476_t